MVKADDDLVGMAQAGRGVNVNARGNLSEMKKLTWETIRALTRIKFLLDMRESMPIRVIFHKFRVRHLVSSVKLYAAIRGIFRHASLYVNLFVDRVTKPEHVYIVSKRGGSYLH